MRVGLGLAFVFLASGLAFAAERNGLPDFFNDSFDAVAQKPLAPYSPDKPEETGAIPQAAVPMPPERPEVAAVVDTVIKRKPLRPEASPRSAAPRERDAPTRIISSVPTSEIAPGTAASQPAPS